MSKAILLTGTVFAVALMARVAEAQVAPAAPAAADSSSPLDAITSGKPILEVRGRYEGVDQTKTATLTADAQAYTVRVHLGWQTASWENLQTLVEASNVSVIGSQDYAVNVPGATTPPLNGADKAKYPLINDPTTTELNRAQLTWTPSDLFSATVGRQRILIDDQRFVGNVNWRQDEQTFDAIRADGHLGNLHIFYAYLNHINRTLAQNKDFDSNSHLLNVRYDITPDYKLEAFAYLLDFGNSAINSSATRGVKGSGKNEVGPIKLAYDATYAHQSDYANAPAPFDLDFYAADLSATYDIGTLRLDYEQLNGNGVRGFTTPLATTHSFQGWADAFVSPGGNKSFVDGIDDYNILMSVRPPISLAYLSKLELLVGFHDFKDQRFGNDVAHEWDLSATANVTENLVLLLKYADFQRDITTLAGAAAPPPSRDKVWLSFDYNL
jgi:hypothetical protein